MYSDEHKQYQTLISHFHHADNEIGFRSRCHYTTTWFLYPFVHNSISLTFIVVAIVMVSFDFYGAKSRNGRRWSIYIRWNVAVSSEWLLFISIYNWNEEHEVIIFTMFRVPCTLSFAVLDRNLFRKMCSWYIAAAANVCPCTVHVFSLHRVLTGFVHLLSLIYRCRATTNLLIVRPTQHNNSIRSKRLNSITFTIF